MFYNVGFYIIIFSIEFLMLFLATVFYQNCKQERKHEKELQERELQEKETENSITENEQMKELLTMIKDYYN